MINVEALIHASKILHRHKILPTCITCDHFNHKLEACKLAGNRRPPVEVIVYGCELWEDDRIPF